MIEIFSRRLEKNNRGCEGCDLLDTALCVTVRQRHQCNFEGLSEVIGRRYYLIRDKRNGTYMPEVQKGRGYSYWSPSDDNCLSNAKNTPRLFESRQKAQNAINTWAKGEYSREAQQPELRIEVGGSAADAIQQRDLGLVPLTYVNSITQIKFKKGLRHKNQLEIVEVEFPI